MMTACILLLVSSIGGTGVNDDIGRTAADELRVFVSCYDLTMRGDDAGECRAEFEGLLHSENRHKFKL